MENLLGRTVHYRQRPGQVRAGQQDLAAKITKVWPDGSASLRIYVPDSPDVLLQPKVQRMSQEVTTHCWFIPEIANPELDEMRAQLTKALDRIEALENRPRLGRPPKSEAAAA